MRNYYRVSIFVGFIGVCLLLGQMGCTKVESKKDILTEGVPSPSPTSTPVLSGEKVLLSVSSEVGRREVTKHCSIAETSFIEKGSLRRKKIEVVGFRATAITEALDKTTGNVTQKLTVSEKVGQVDLHDMAFPEVGETIQFVFAPNGKVVKAGDYPKDSIFFVPPLPFAGKLVSLNESWRDVTRWKSGKNSIEFVADVTSKVVGLEKCGKGSCALVEVSGTVEMPKDLQKTTGFKHELAGKYTYEVKRGLMVKALFESKETMSSGENRVEVKSTLKSQLEEPGDLSSGENVSACSIPQS